MKQLASVELTRVVKELKERLLDGKINQIYVDFDRVNNTKKELLFEIYVSNKGRQLLRIILPSLIFLAQCKPEMPIKPEGYCLYLRKWLKNARVKDIEQLAGERIIKITVEARDVTKKEPIPVLYFLIIELFSKGNLILADAQNIILSPLEIQEWSERKIKAKEPYTFPCHPYSLFSSSQEEFGTAIENCMKEKDSLVTALALDFGLGGLYAEELCLRAKIPKETKKLSSEEIKRLFWASQKLKEEIEENKIFIVKQNNDLIDIVPCTIQKYTASQYTLEIVSSFLDALDSCFGPVSVSPLKITVEKSKQTKAQEKLQTMIKSQEKQIQNCQEDYEKNQNIGKKIYEQYVLLEDIFKQLAEARKTKSWEEIKKAVKNHKIIKQINEKNQEIMVEI